MLSGVVTGQAVEGQRMRNATAALSKHFQKLRQYELGVDELQVRRRRWNADDVVSMNEWTKKGGGTEIIYDRVLYILYIYNDYIYLCMIIIIYVWL